VNSIVLDASVVLAIVHQEPGSEKLTPDLLTKSAISTVNLAEAQSKLVISGWNVHEAWLDATSPVSEIVPFTAGHARTAANLVSQTRSLGLSLGDCACLALALEMKPPVYTADRSWKKLKLAIRIHVIR
jgi:PIN domain nuclease of toxin-antitoxin system